MRIVNVSVLTQDEVFGWLRSHYDEEVIESIYAEAEQNIWGEEMHNAAVKFAEKDIRNLIANQR